MNVNRYVKLACAVFVLFLLLSCSENTPKLAPLANDAVILAFGDSLTFGTGAKPEESYPAVLQQLIKIPVINAGVPGEVSQDGLKRLASSLDEHQPDLIILCHGGNDMLRKKSPAQTKSNLKSMILLAQQHGASVILLGVPKPTLFSLKSAPFYADLAAEFSIPINGEIIPNILGDNSVKADTIHPNAKGYQLIADQVRNLLHKSGAI